MSLQAWDTTATHQDGMAGWFDMWGEVASRWRGIAQWQGEQSGLPATLDEVARRFWSGRWVDVSEVAGDRPASAAFGHWACAGRAR